MDREPGDWPGRRLGLPERGSHSLAPLWRRLLALGIDWGMCLALGNLIPSDNPFIVPAIFALEHFLLVSTLGYTVGHRILFIEVRRLNGHVPGSKAGFIRTVLLATVIPALVFDRDHRGLHDRLAGTVILKR